MQGGIAANASWKVSVQGNRARPETMGSSQCHAQSYASLSSQCCLHSTHHCSSGSVGKAQKIKSWQHRIQLNMKQCPTLNSAIPNYTLSTGSRQKKSLLKGWVTNGNSYSCGNCLRFKRLMSCHGNPRLLFSNVLAPMPTERHGWTHAVSGWQMWWQMVAGSRCKKQKNHF